MKERAYRGRREGIFQKKNSKGMELEARGIFEKNFFRDQKIQNSVRPQLRLAPLGFRGGLPYTPLKRQICRK